jgi:hypothetical protein
MGRPELTRPPSSDEEFRTRIVVLLLWLADLVGSLAALRGSSALGLPARSARSYTFARFIDFASTRNRSQLIVHLIDKSVEGLARVQVTARTANEGHRHPSCRSEFIPTGY